jgi:hypothetical protein
VDHGDGHFSIVPLTESGEIGDDKLREWSSFRKSGVQHRFTRIVLDARTEEDARRPP